MTLLSMLLAFTVSRALWGLVYIIIFAFFIWILIYVLELIFPPIFSQPRVRGLILLLAFLLCLIWFLNFVGILA